MVIVDGAIVSGVLRPAIGNEYVVRAAAVLLGYPCLRLMDELQWGSKITASALLAGNIGSDGRGA